jgi:hypothetical protein
VLWGEKDGWIAAADLKTMAAVMPIAGANHGAGHWAFDES